MLQNKLYRILVIQKHVHIKKHVLKFLSTFEQAHIFSGSSTEEGRQAEVAALIPAYHRCRLRKRLPNPMANVHPNGSEHTTYL